MDLHFTLVRGPGAGRDEAPLELTASAAGNALGSELEQELSRTFGTRRLSVGGLPLSALVIGRPPLVTGAVIVDGGGGIRERQPRRSGQDIPAALLLAVHSGPAAGSLLPLRRGSYRIGRTAADLTIPDPDLSRQHARIDVTDSALNIRDLGSANGIEVDGKRVRSAAISTDSMISCGRSTLSIVVAGPPGSRTSCMGAAGVSVAEPLSVPRPPGQENRGMLFLSALLPVALGVALALLTGMWMFLAFTAVSAVTLVVPIVSGRRSRRRLRSAVVAAAAADKERRRRSAPSPAELVLDSPGMAVAAEATPDVSGVWLRLGLAEQPANVRLEPPDPAFQPPGLGAVPFLLDPRAGVVSVRGPESETSGLMHLLLMQLTGYPSAQGTRIAVCGPVNSLPLAARYLPNVTLHGRMEDMVDDLAGDPAGGGIPSVLVLITSGETNLSLERLCEVARQSGWRVFRFLPPGAGPAAWDPSDADIELAGSYAVLRSMGSTHQFVADLVPADVFAHYCRRAKQDTGVPVRGRSVPASCMLSDVLDLSTEATALRWSVGRVAPGLAIPVGQGGDGPRILDLEADGPHLLVAGTTGSGKSELLRTLSVGLALSYPPDRMNILFVDFKGGSGLGPLTALPHCVGIVTDLTRSELDRTMASLRAEVRRREQLLAAAEAPDLTAYRLAGRQDAPSLPQLVVIIDEFRMLVDDAPKSLNELMRIATVGRSLGLHLVMATQRPQGAINADIRANVTTSIALRVQSAHESADIIGTTAAATIAVETPGRAFLMRGNQEPAEFQSAALSTGGIPGRTHSGVVVCRTVDALSARPPRSAEKAFPAPPPTPAAAAAPLVEALNSLWQECGTGPVRRPVAPPLPTTPTYPRPPAGSAAARFAADGLTPDGPAGDLLPAEAPDRATGSPVVELGWLDLPHQQEVTPLSWQPIYDGHLAFIGGTSGDAVSAMSLVLDQLAVDPVDSHLYVLDADGSFARMQASSRTGAVTGLHDLRRGVRVLERLCGEMSRRLSDTGTLHHVPLVLAISGWGSWLSAMRSGPLMWGEDLVQDIMRNGRRAGITAILSGERDLAVSRFLSDIPNRVYFPRGASVESRFAWPKMPEVLNVRGRGVAFGSIAGGGPAVCQFHASDGQPGPDAQRRILTRPFKVEALPRRLPVEDMLGLMRRKCNVRPPGAGQAANGVAQPVAGTRCLWVGVGGDDLSPVALRLPPAGAVAVLGAPGSGKTSLLAALRVLNAHLRTWLQPGPGLDPDDYWTEIHKEAAAGRLGRDSFLLIDDAERLAFSTHQKLLEMNSLGCPVVLCANYGQSLLQRAPIAMAARNGGTGILIAPRSHMDGDLFGARFELEPNPPPGRAVLLADGRATPVQLPVATAGTPDA
ncbi:FtsK/SpoIIIE domain-containing protein [Arthrobacter sp. D1-17]